MRVLTTIDAIWMFVVQPASSNWTSQISHEAVASLLSKQSVCAVQMSLYSIAAKYNGPLEAAHACFDDDRCDMDICRAAGQLQLDLQISHEAVASLLPKQSVCAVQMSLYSIATKYNGPLEAAHACFDDDRCDMDVCGAAGQFQLDLSDQPRGCSIASIKAIRLRSANELV